MQIVFGAILAISLLLAINFSGRIAAGRRIDAERGELMDTIASLEAEATALHTELNFVNSDAFIEQWARRDGRMIRDDEMLVVPVPAQSTPVPAPTMVVARPAAPEDDAPQNWQLWWQLFFDSPPPTGN
jgi:cell division protein FtsB